MEDLYKILGVPKTATQDEIKKAYRELALKYHPDRNQGNIEAENRLKEINAAYTVLSDPGQRYSYDASQSNPFSDFNSQYQNQYQRQTENNYGHSQGSYYDPFGGSDFYSQFSNSDFKFYRKSYSYDSYGRPTVKKGLSKLIGGIAADFFGLYLLFASGFISILGVLAGCCFIYKGSTNIISGVSTVIKALTSKK